jgi:hypothetical protein
MAMHLLAVTSSEMVTTMTMPRLEVSEIESQQE